MTIIVDGTNGITTDGVETFLKFDGVPVGQGANNISSNVAVGETALGAITTGSQSTGVGYEALRVNTTGIRNSAFGFDALYSSTTGDRNTGIGRGTIYANATGSDNTAVGTNSQFSYTSGSYNTSVGSGALQGSSSSGSENTAIGYNAAYSNTTGTKLVAAGFHALYTNTTGINNTALGYKALTSNTTASYNGAVGDRALHSNTTGAENNSFGYASLYTNTTGSYNVAFGSTALYSNTTASNNTAVGYQAGYSGTTSLENTFVGYQAGYSVTTGTGRGVFVGMSAGFSTTTGLDNVAIGMKALYSNQTGGQNVVIGSGEYGIALHAGYYVTGSKNTLIGYSAGNAITTGSKNTIIGGYNGNQGGLDIRTSNNYIVLSDGDGNPRVFHDGSWLYSPNSIAQGNTQNINYGSGLSFGAAGKGLLFQQTVNTNDERVYLTNNAQTSTSTGSGFTGAFAYNKTSASASAYLQVAGYHQFFSAGTGTAGDLISFTSVFCTRKDETIALQGAGNHSGTGITFPATQNASSNANTLDDYEEGTFTPSYIGSSSNPTVSYNQQSGRYIKIGQFVQITVEMETTSVAGGGGDLYVGGLPFAALNDRYVGGAVTAYASSWTTRCPRSGYFIIGGTSIALTSDTSATAQTNIPTANLTTTGTSNYLIMTAVYRAAA